MLRYRELNHFYNELSKGNLTFETLVTLCMMLSENLTACLTQDNIDTLVSFSRPMQKTGELRVAQQAHEQLFFSTFEWGRGGKKSIISFSTYHLPDCITWNPGLLVVSIFMVAGAVKYP